MRKERELVLVNPNNEGNYVQGTMRREHLGLGLLQAELLASGFNTEIIDSRIAGQSPQKAACDILEIRPFMVGFSMIAKTSSKWCEKVAEIIKEEDPNIHIVLGNYFPSLQPTRALDSVRHADSVVIREGDLTLPDLARHVYDGNDLRRVHGICYRDGGGIRTNAARELVRDLDLLPTPIHHAKEFSLREYAIEGSRGCLWRCTYCSIPVFFGERARDLRWRSRSPQRIVDEMTGLLRSEENIRLFRFVDPDFVGSARYAHRLRELVDLIRKQGLEMNFIIDTRTNTVLDLPPKIWADLRSVGLSEVYLGVENIDPEIKKKMRKGTTYEQDMGAIQRLNELGIKTRIGFMMLTPWSTLDDVRTNAASLSKLGFPRLDKYFQEMYLVPGTDAVSMVSDVSKIWFDENGEGEYYTYELAHPLGNVRRIFHTMISDHRDFMDETQRVHAVISDFIGEQQTNCSIITCQYNNFSLEFFLTVLERAILLGENPEDRAVRDTCMVLVREFSSRLSSIQTSG